MDNSLSLSAEIPDANSQKWYTIEELASLSGISVETLKSGHSPLKKMSINLEVNIQSGGYHNTQKFYSEDVLKALREYQFKNSVPNAVVKKNDYIESHSGWYTLEEISQLSGLRKDRLNQLLPELCNQLQNSNNTRLGGYHNTQKFYSENVLKALKQYQLRNSVPNALKNREVAVSGNVSFVQNQTVKATIDNLLNNPDTLQLLLNESLAKTQRLGIENKQLKEVIAIQKPKVEVYDAICDSVTLQDLQTVAITIGLKNIFKVLLADGILEERYTDDNQHFYKPKADYSQYLVLKDGKPWTDDNGISHVRPRVFVTGKGLNWLTKRYPKES